MVKGKKGDSDTTLSTKKAALTCIGNVCFDPETNTLTVDIKKDGCPPALVKRIVEGWVKGAKVNVTVPSIDPE